MRQRSLAGALSLLLFGAGLLAGCATTADPSASPSTTPSIDQPRAVPATPSVPQVPDLSTSASPDPSSPDASPGDEPTLAPVSKNVTEVATKYLKERENASSHYRTSPTEWLDKVKPLMTSDGYKQVRAGVSEDAGDDRVWQVSHEQGLAVKVTAECQVDTAGGDTDTFKALVCTITDMPVDKDGNLVPTTKIPDSWPYAGTNTATLNMTNTAEGWRVSLDASGMAG